MKNHLSRKQTEQYRKEGFLAPLDALSPDEFRYYQQQWLNLKKVLPSEQNAVRAPHLFLNLPWAYALATHPRILDVVESVLGENILIRGGLILSKPSDANTFVSWHQDAHYANDLSGTEALTCWLAFSESKVANGCMRVLPASQNQHFDHVEIYDDKNMLALGQTVEGVNNDHAVDLELNPGQMSLHHINVLHCSNVNHSGNARTGFIVRYCTPGVKQEEGRTLIYARGKTKYTHLDLITTPPLYSIEEGIHK